MKKITILLFFAVLSFNMYSQNNYHSVLSNDTCRWIVPRLTLESFWMDTIWAFRNTEDTFLLALKTPYDNAKIYGKMYSSKRNDKLFFVDLESQERFVIMDMSLIVGDTFTIRDEYSQFRNITVDSVYYKDGRKHIQFNDEIGFSSYSSLYIHPKRCFIEGVGPNWGFCPKEEGTTFFVCKHEGDIIYYSYPDTTLFVNCSFNSNYFGTEVRLTEKKHLIVWPNPTSNFFNIVLPNNVKHLAIYSATGTLCFSTSFDTDESQIFSFDMSRYSKGIYLMRIISEDTQETLKIIKNQ